jgi:hypothetical protein
MTSPSGRSADPFDTYMAAKLGKPVAQVTAALDADEAHCTPEREARPHADLIAALPARHLLTIEREPGAEPLMKIDGQQCRVVTIYVRDALIRVVYEASNRGLAGEHS